MSTTPISMEPRKYVFVEQENPKKKRNRLAQRKHRRQDRRDSRTAPGTQEQNSEPAQTKTTSSVEMGQQASGLSTAFQVTAMDFSLSDKPMLAATSKDLADIDQRYEPVYPNVDTHLMMGEMEQEHGNQLPPSQTHSDLDTLSMLYGITGQGLPRPSYSTSDFETNRRDLRGSYLSPVQEPARRPSGPCSRIPRRISDFSDATYSVGMSSIEDDRHRSASSVTSYATMNPDPVTAGSDHSCDQDDSDSETTGMHDLGSRFERVMEVLEEAGFESFDSMLAQYYTASFKKDSTSYWAQSRSRSRSLPHFLASLHESTKNWNDREAQGYRRHIIGIAENLYINEFTCAKRSMKQSERQVACDPTTAPSSSSSLRTPRDPCSVQDLWHNIADLDLNPALKKKKALICESMPEAWSLLIEWTRKAGLRQSRGSQAAAAFLLLLLDSDQEPSGNASKISR